MIETDISDRFFLNNMSENWIMRWDDKKIILQKNRTEKTLAYDLIVSPCCDQCGNQLIRQSFCWNELRHKNLQNAEKVFSMGSYYSNSHRDQQPDCDVLTQHILKLKDDYSFAKPLGEAMALTLIHNYSEMLEADIIVPIPSFGKKSNHASALGCTVLEYISKVTDTKITLHEALIKTKKDRLHLIRSANQRQEVVREMYCSNQNISVTGKDIILIDDLLTTGATKNECIRILKINGAKRIWVFVSAAT